MAIKINQFMRLDQFSVLVHYPSKFRGTKTTSEIGYVLDKGMKEKVTVFDYLKTTLQSDEKIEVALSLVKLKASLFTVSLCHLTKVETKKVQLAYALLVHSKCLVFEYFFEDLIYSERDYFKRFFRNLLYKQKIAILFITNDMNFVCETVKEFYLFTKGEKFKLITNFYDDEIYKYVERPYTVELVKYLEAKGHEIDHDITFNETLKSIYRGVS